MSDCSERVVLPELLDQLPPADPRAVHSRQDLRRVNAWMGNDRTLARAWLRYAPPGPIQQVIDLGAGDGAFLLRLALRLRQSWEGAILTLVDPNQPPHPAVAERATQNGFQVQFVQQDAISFLLNQNLDSRTAIVANLFLHHLAQPDLRNLLRLVAQKAQFFLACEPRRSSLAKLGTRLLWLLACNHVTCHDAKVSVRAGFRGNELTTLWSEPGWYLHEQPAGLFSHCFVARRNVHHPG